jgi:hypothetical protein
MGIISWCMIYDYILKYCADGHPTGGLRTMQPTPPTFRGALCIPEKIYGVLIFCLCGSREIDTECSNQAPLERVSKRP